MPGRSLPGTTTHFPNGFTMSTALSPDNDPNDNATGARPPHSRLSNRPVVDREVVVTMSEGTVRWYQVRFRMLRLVDRNRDGGTAPRTPDWRVRALTTVFGIESRELSSYMGGHL